MLSVLERVNLVETESHRLEEYLGSLAANAWSQSSKCDLWTVADVLAHLTWASDYFMTAIAAGRKGDVSPPHGWPETGTSGPEFFNSFIGEKAIEARKNLGDGLFQEFQARNHQLPEIFASVTLMSWTSLATVPSLLATSNPLSRAAFKNWPSTVGTFNPALSPPPI